MLSFLQSLCRAVAAAWHRVWGRFWFRLSSPDRARAHFERVLHLQGDDFQAYVYLGRLAYAQGDYSGWRREFEHARRTDPQRFERLGEVGELFALHGRAGAQEAADRATWSRPGSARQEPRSADAGEGPNAWWHPSREAWPSAATGEPEVTWDPAVFRPRHRHRRRRDDCANERERQRFARLGPIRRDELRHADVDELARRFGR
jgi:hypothetical protein